MTKKQTANVLLEQLKTPLQRKVLNAIGYGDDLPEITDHSSLSRGGHS